MEETISRDACISHYIVTKVSNYQENVILNVYAANNRASKHMSKTTSRDTPTLLPNSRTVFSSMHRAFTMVDTKQVSMKSKGFKSDKVSPQTTLEFNYK